MKLILGKLENSEKIKMKTRKKIVIETSTIECKSEVVFLEWKSSERIHKLIDELSDLFSILSFSLSRFSEPSHTLKLAQCVNVVLFFFSHNTRITDFRLHENAVIIPFVQRKPMIFLILEINYL